MTAKTIKLDEIGKKKLKIRQNWQNFAQVNSILFNKKKIPKVNNNQIKRQRTDLNHKTP